MAGRDLKLDAFGDPIPDGNGGYETTTTQSSAVYHQIRGALGSWVGGPESGSRLDSVSRGKSFADLTVAEFEDAIRTALQPLVDAGRIRAVEFRGERILSRIVTETSIVDAQSGQAIPLVEVLPSLP